MTDTPDDLPSPDEFRRKMAHVDQEFADARRYLSALCAEDNQRLGALMAEIHHSGRAMNVLAAMAVQALDFAHLSADRLGGDVQKWLDESVMAQDTAEKSGTKPNSAARDNFGAVPDPFRDLRVAVVLHACPTAARRAPIYQSLANAVRDDHLRDGDLRLRPNRPGPSRTECRLEIELELNQSAHHCRPMMVMWRWRLVWVRLGLMSNSKR